MKKINLLLIILGIIYAIPAISLAAVGSNWIEQWGIRWTFDKNISLDGEGDTYQYGQFVNGDYWIVGPVKIISIDPPYAVVDSQTRTGNVLRDRGINGSMINPRVTSEQGYTNGSGGFNPDLCVNIDIRMDNPLHIDTSEIPIKSLISTISTGVVPDDSNGIRIGEPHLKTAAVLTIMVSPPSADAFRPPFVGNVKPGEIRASRINLNVTPLKNLEPTAGAPTFEQAERWIERVWLSHQMAWYHSFMHPVDNCPYYGRDIGIRINHIALLLNTRTSLDKTRLMNLVVQSGIDRYGTVLDNPRKYTCDGGGLSGWFLSFVVAAHLLDHPGMKEILTRVGEYRYNAVDEQGIPYWPTRATPGYVNFAELDQTHYVTQFEVDLTNGTYIGPRITSVTTWTPDPRYLPHTPYTAEDIGLPEYGLRHATFPGCNNNEWEASSYRGVNCNFTGAALVGHIMGIKHLFNHPAFFDYCDRFMAKIVEYPENSLWRTTMGVFVTNMWNAYRADYGPVWMPESMPNMPDPNRQSYEVSDKTGLIIRNNIIKGADVSAAVKLFLAEAGNASVKIYNSKGREIITLWDGYKDAGTYDLIWTGVDSGGNKVGSGVYMVHLKAGSYKKTKKIVIVR